MEGEETLTVPAGTFRTLKIVYRNASSGAVSWQQWYAPDVRMWIRTHEPARDDGERTVELVSYTPAGKPTQARRSDDVPAATITDSKGR